MDGPRRFAADIAVIAPLVHGEVFKHVGRQAEGLVRKAVVDDELQRVALLGGIDDLDGHAAIGIALVVAIHVRAADPVRHDRQRTGLHAERALVAAPSARPRLAILHELVEHLGAMLLDDPHGVFGVFQRVSAHVVATGVGIGAGRILIGEVGQFRFGAASDDLLGIVEGVAVLDRPVVIRADIDHAEIALGLTRAEVEVGRQVIHDGAGDGLVTLPFL